MLSRLRRRRVTRVALAISLLLLLTVSPAAHATPVATDDATYLAYGRVFPDPHGCVKGTPGKSPYAKGNVCATQFIQFPELVAGLRYLNQKFPRFMEVYELPNASAGLPTSTLDRKKHSLWAVRVTDEQVGGAKKKFAFALSIHGIERAGAEGGTRAIEDLVTWGTQEPGRGLLDETLGTGNSAVTVGQVLAQSELWFFYPNADGWVRGDVNQAGLMYQRYNGNGVDLNRDWPTRGYTFRPYTPASEPEVKAVTDFFKSGPAAGGQWAGGADLHGMVDAGAFTYTMLPAGEYDYARNKAIVGVARRIQQDATPRLSWFLGIQSGQNSGSVPQVAQQWGTTWDTIEYTITGGLGDWLSTPIGLDGYVGMNNEMWVSHLAPNNTFVADLEQAHIDGNKGLIFAQIEGAFRTTASTFPLNGRLAYVDHGRRFSHPGSPTSQNPYPNLPPQDDLTADVVSPTASGTDSPAYEFVVKSPGDGVYNGGFTVKVTYTNVQGVSPGDLITTVYVERAGDAHEGHTWDVVNQNFNQNQAYAAAGHTVNVNTPLPGLYRVRLSHAPPGVHRIHVDFTNGPAWPDPGQAAYSVTSAKFFQDLNAYLPADRQAARLTAEDILGGADLSTYDTVVLVNDPLPGWYEAETRTGEAQPDLTFTRTVPVPGTEDLQPFEFDVRPYPEFNNQSMVVSVSWDIRSDYDVYVDRQNANGTWTQVGKAENFLNNGETVEIGGMPAGRYRVRIVNFAAVAQELRGKVDFRNTRVGPPAYPVTRSPAERDAYYARLQQFVREGGNLVLTDGAARALPHLGIDKPITKDDVTAQVVYAPNIAFTTNGTDRTYDDPLAKNVNQPGAAEGTGARHQTVEPVPLGYAIQNAFGDDRSTSFTWTVGKAAWTGAGGRVAGTLNGQVALGELPLGAGKVRFVGALLPDPEVRYDHPFGLHNYALTYTGWQLFENAVQWQRPPLDLAVSAADIALSAERVTGGDRVTFTATIRNLGQAPVSGVAVRFAVDDTQVGTDQAIASIPAGGTGTATVTWEAKGNDGTHRLTVAVDPANKVRETDEQNNTASRTFTIRGNKLRNGSFETSSTGQSPDGWTSSGTTSYAQGGSDGQRAVTADATGAWTSDPVAVQPGAAYGLAVDVTGGAGRLAIEQLSSTGAVLSTLTQALSVADATRFTTVTAAFTTAAEATHVRVRLLGGLVGTTTFDNARLLQE